MLLAIAALIAAWALTSLDATGAAAVAAAGAVALSALQFRRASTQTNQALAIAKESLAATVTPLVMLEYGDVLQWGPLHSVLETTLVNYGAGPALHITIEVADPRRVLHIDRVDVPLVLANGQRAPLTWRHANYLDTITNPRNVIDSPEHVPAHGLREAVSDPSATLAIRYADLRGNWFATCAVFELVKDPDEHRGFRFRVTGVERIPTPATIRTIDTDAVPLYREDEKAAIARQLGVDNSPPDVAVNLRTQLAHPKDLGE